VDSALAEEPAKGLRAITGWSRKPWLL
jgi:hypothetical protein